MNPKNGPFAQQEESSFESLLDITCIRLQEKQAQYSVRRLGELDLILEDMERELDILVCLTADQTNMGT